METAEYEMLRVIENSGSQKERQYIQRREGLLCCANYHRLKKDIS